MSRFLWFTVYNKKLCYRKEVSASVGHRSIVRCKRHFDMLNRLGVDHECDRQTDGRMKGQIASGVINVGVTRFGT